MAIATPENFEPADPTVSAQSPTAMAEQLAVSFGMGDRLVEEGGKGGKEGTGRQRR